MAWSSIPLPPGARWTGVGLTILTAVLLVWTLRSLGPNLTDTVVTRAAHTLVTRGPYRWVRHPFYDCMALFIVSIALMMANWFVMVAGGIMFALLAIRSRTEEDKLLERFGEPYRAYRAATGRPAENIRIMSSGTSARRWLRIDRSRQHQSEDLKCAPSWSWAASC